MIKWDKLLAVYPFAGDPCKYKCEHYWACNWWMECNGECNCSEETKVLCGGDCERKRIIENNLQNKK